MIVVPLWIALIPVVQMLTVLPLLIWVLRRR